MTQGIPKPDIRERLWDELAAREALAVKRARRNFLAFTKWTKPNYQINWHHRRIANALDAVHVRTIKRLLVMVAPRHGKTELVSRRFPAYVLGRDPAHQIIAASYADSLAARNNRDVQRVIDAPTYARVFPGTKLNSGNVRADSRGALRNSDLFEIVGHGGSYRSAGVGAGITGLGADCLLVDDPVKNWKEAMSKTLRDSVWEWYTSTAFTRLEKGGAVVVVMTQWHEDDLAGRILRGMNDEDEEPWHVLKFEAVKETDIEGDPRKKGEALWPEKYSAKDLRAIQTQLGPRIWAALYQQNPVGEDGNIWRSEWWRRWRELPRLEEVILSADLRFKDHRDSGSWVVVQAWGKCEGDYFLLDQIRGRWGYLESVKAFVAFADKFPKAHLKLVEDKANGPALESHLRAKVKGIRLVAPQGSKTVRAMACEHVIAAGRVWVPEDEKRFPWVPGFLRETAAFSASMSHTEDDQVDSASQAILYFDQGSSAADTIRKLIHM